MHSIKVVYQPAAQRDVRNLFELQAQAGKRCLKVMRDRRQDVCALDDVIAQPGLHGVEGSHGITHLVGTALEQRQAIEIAAERARRARQIVERRRRHARGKEGETAHADGQYQQEHRIEAWQAKVIGLPGRDQYDLDRGPIGESGRNQPAIQRHVNAMIGAPRKAAPRYDVFGPNAGANAGIQPLRELSVGSLDFLLAARRPQAGDAARDHLHSKRHRGAVYQRDEILYAIGDTFQLDASKIRLPPHVRYSQGDGCRSNDPDQQEEEKAPRHGPEVALQHYSKVTSVASTYPWLRTVMMSSVARASSS